MENPTENAILPDMIAADEWLLPNLDTLITEDDTPVDNMFSAKQQRLLVETLQGNVSLWNPDGRTFVADANVGLFAVPKNTPLVPDAFVSMDVALDGAQDIHTTKAYFAWVFGKMPEVVIEVVSNRKGGEMERKFQQYARQHIPYYAVFDPNQELGGELFQLYELKRGTYSPMADFWMSEINLGLRTWEGEYEGVTATWLRWCDDRGRLLPTTAESRNQEKIRADRENDRANHETTRADREKARAEELNAELTAERSRAARLAEQLRALGINPDS